ncbi:MAG TPA: LacI family DNA-binding transcriptional regulator, partial [Clostridia bacterium]|nr:LacI family DNA-binding transcriptional regulator [Clostridia bacterium]
MFKPQGKRIGIKDVAKAAGTSPTTVSRVLNDTGYPVSEALRERILAVAKELDYTPNMLGRMLQSDQSQELGIVIPNIVNPFYTQIVLGLETESRRGGYGVLLCNTLRSISIETSSLRSLFDKRILGVAIASVAKEHSCLRSLQQQGMKVVVVDQEIPDVDACGRVGFNYVRAGILAAEHLIKTGHGSTAYLSSPLNRHSRRDLLEGFRQGHARYGLSFPPGHVLVDEAEAESDEGIYELECAQRLTRRLLRMKKRPEGIFVTNDLIAIGVLSELAEQGVSVPAEISVIGFDNIFLSKT